MSTLPNYIAGLPKNHALRVDYEARLPENIKANNPKYLRKDVALAKDGKQIWKAVAPLPTIPENGS